ncbi:4-oxalocrotonate tautomerase [Epibacterium ulvae]|uniref:4-oxalocrotonate tautomerase n=2 Tax=Alphaproteobacteria TaxID=28211 RepID=A0A1G5QHD0_9RHOB|nr:tautomerase family protein [Epibacterium ulvae]AFT64147.1 4-oxalocrotonate tautomerase [alpha proteobacterium U95]SCZ61204.1 4-oxalocrotonate tautomerase [Epibacterium ulvae]
MPHIDIAYFDKELTETQLAQLDKDLTQVICTCLKVPASAVSIGLEPVAPDVWNTQIALPRIVTRAASLLRQPDYPLPKPDTAHQTKDI